MRRIYWRLAMSIIPASHLSACDLAILGNNLSSRRRNPQRRHLSHRRQLAAVNRSLASTGEKIGTLYAACLSQPSPAVSAVAC
jgi:hypothetical protein